MSKPHDKRFPYLPGIDAMRRRRAGDSVMVAAADSLAARLSPGFSMNAQVGREADQFVDLVQRLRRQGHHPDALIIQMGNNGPLYSEEMEAIQKASAGVGELFLINDHAPVGWIGESNHALAEAGETWPHTTPCRLGLARRGARRRALGRHPPKPAAVGLYTRLISRVAHEKVAFPPPKRQAATWDSAERRLREVRHRPHREAG